MRAIELLVNVGEKTNWCMLSAGQNDHNERATTAITRGNHWVEAR